MVVSKKVKLEIEVEIDMPVVDISDDKQVIGIPSG
jgi:hypothetical protein